jgi:hypothetical protein
MTMLGHERIVFCLAIERDRDGVIVSWGIDLKVNGKLDLWKELHLASLEEGNEIGDGEFK